MNSLINMMTNQEGWTITTIYITLIVLIITAKIMLRYVYKNKYYNIQNYLLLILTIIPASFMFIIGERWVFGPNYLPTNNPVNDLTFSGFHFVFIAWMIVTAIAFAFIGKGHRDDHSQTYFHGKMDKIDYTIFRLGLFLLAIETYKQLVFANLWDGLDQYQWYAFPLQFCSVPIFFFLFAPWFKNKALKDASYEFIGLYVTLAGLLVMIVGGSVFTNTVAISVHTMLWHGMMVVAGVYLIFAKGIGTNYKQLVRASLFLVGLIILVQIVNIHFHYMGEYLENGPGGFSGFFISPWENGFSMPVLGAWQKALYESAMPRALSATLYSIIYFLAFTVGASLVYGLTYGIRQLVKMTNKKPTTH